jgi:hypothetical protein
VFYGLGTALAFVVLTAVTPGLPLLARGLLALYPALVAHVLGLAHELGHLAAAAYAGVPILAVVFGWWGPAVVRSSGCSRRADALSALAGPCTGLVAACVLWVMGNMQDSPVFALPWHLASAGGIAFNVMQLLPLRLGKLETDGLHVLRAYRGA